ncbi:MAG: hypothetical protein NVV73_19405 [Cellvibrionaceae bacterium]|nr:hypothetical protein [Cellvibrionaceae bacterium]
MWSVLRRRRALTFAALGLLAVIVLFALLDRVFPLHLPEQDQLYARVVVDREGRPLRAFPDAAGVWRYEVGLDEISPPLSGCSAHL